MNNANALKKMTMGRVGEEFSYGSTSQILYRGFVAHVDARNGAKMHSVAIVEDCKTGEFSTHTKCRPSKKMGQQVGAIYSGHANCSKCK